jgi:hypothetical protein
LKWFVVKDVFLDISLGFKSFEHVEKKLKVILCLGPRLRLFQKSTKIFHLTKPNELKIWELGIDIFFHVIPKFEVDLSSCVMGEAWEVVGDKILHQKSFNTNFASGAIISKTKEFFLELVEDLKSTLKICILKYNMQSYI